MSGQQGMGAGGNDGGPDRRQAAGRFEAKPASVRSARERPLIHAGALAGLEAHCTRIGLDYRAIARRHDLDGALDGDRLMSRHVGLDNFALMLSTCARMSGDPLFALNWTRAAGPEPDDTVRLAARHAATLREALETLVRYVRVKMDVARAGLVSEGATASLYWAFPATLACSQQLTDRVASSLSLRLLAISNGTNAMVSVALARPEPANTALYDEVFKVPVEFDAAVTRLRFRSSALDAPNPLHDPQLHEALCDLNRRRLRDRRIGQDFVSRVREAIAMSLERPDLTLADIADSLALSSRALQRRLAESRTSFQELHDATRRQLAEDLLGETALPMSEIAFRLGFSSVGNFTRAARRWFGLPPSEWRRLRLDRLGSAPPSGGPGQNV